MQSLAAWSTEWAYEYVILSNEFSETKISFVERCVYAKHDDKQGKTCRRVAASKWLEAYSPRTEGFSTDTQVSRVFTDQYICMWRRHIY